MFCFSVEGMPAVDVLLSCSGHASSRCSVVVLPVWEGQRSDWPILNLVKRWWFRRLWPVLRVKIVTCVLWAWRVGQNIASHASFAVRKSPNLLIQLQDIAVHTGSLNTSEKSHDKPDTAEQKTNKQTKQKQKKKRRRDVRQDKINFDTQHWISTNQYDTSKLFSKFFFPS